MRALWANSPWRFESSPAHDERPVFIGVFASSPSSSRDGEDARGNTRGNSDYEIHVRSEERSAKFAFELKEAGGEGGQHHGGTETEELLNDLRSLHASVVFF